MKLFSEHMRYEYPLTPDSVVIDCGCYEGNFARLINEKYGCRVIAFEPVGEFYTVCQRNLAASPRVQIFNLGVGGHSRNETWWIHGDMTGMVSSGEKESPVVIRDIAEVFSEFGLMGCDLLKVNIEGAEYEVLERLIDTGLIDKMKNIQVQWHSVIPNYEAERATIETALLRTHDRTWERGNFDNSWDDFRLK